MDPISILGLSASIIACMQLTGALLKLAKPSEHGKKDLNRILQVLCGFHGAYDGFKAFLEHNQEDEARTSALQHLEGLCKTVHRY